MQGPAEHPIRYVLHRVITTTCVFGSFQAQHNISVSGNFNPEEVLEQIRKTVTAKQLNFVQFG